MKTTTYCLTMVAAAVAFTGAPQGVHAAPVVPSEPAIGWLFDEQSTAEKGVILANAWGDTNMTLQSFRPGGAGTEMTVTDTPFGLPGGRAWSTLTIGTTRWVARNRTGGDGAWYTPHMDQALSNAPAITVSLWVKLDEYIGFGGSDNTVLECKTDSFYDYLWVSLQADGQVRFGGRSGGSPESFFSYDTTATNTLGQWHHIVGILDFSNQVIQVAIDGGALESTPPGVPFLNSVFTPAAVADGSTTVGAVVDGRRARGLTDELAVWKYALSQDEISWLHQNSVASIPPAGMATLFVGSDVGGSTTPAGFDFYPAGTSVMVTATADTGYLFTGWTGDVVSAANPLAVTLTNTFTGITAEFGPDLADPDGDGLTNFDEAVIYGTDPNVFDTTGDGIGDGEAVNAAVSPTTSYTGIVSVVQGRPADFDLYDETSIHDLNMGGLLIQAETGTVSVAFVLEESTNSVDWTVYEEFLRDIVMPVDKAWLRLRGEEQTSP